MIARNILFNVIGGSWAIILYFALIPIQVRILGIDAYGLLAFISTLQIIFNVFDLGLSMTLAREVAIDTTPALQRTRDLIQTLIVSYVLIGVLLSSMLFAGSDWLVHQWLTIGNLSAASATATLRLAAIAIALRWPVSFLSAVLIGRGRFGLLNLLKAGAATLGLLGGMVVVLVTRDLVAFATWNVLAALAEVTLYFVSCFRILPRFSLRPRVSRTALSQVWRFARDMSLISVVSTILLQSDRLVLSRLVSIEQFGYYVLAYNILFGLMLVQGFITTALFPAFATSFHRGAAERLVQQYTWATQGLVYVFALPVAALMFFGGVLLRVWTSSDAVTTSAEVLRILAPAFLLNATLSVTATLALAIGLTGSILRLNIVALVAYLPTLYLAIGAWGPVGAAISWLLFNLFYLIGMLPLMGQLPIGTTRVGWLLHYLLPFFLLAVICFGLARVLLRAVELEASVATWFLFAVAGLVYAVGGMRFLDPALRLRIWQTIKDWRLLVPGQPQVH